MKKKYADIKNFWLKSRKTDSERKNAMLKSMNDMIGYYKLSGGDSFIERCRDNYTVYLDFGYEPKTIVEDFLNAHKPQQESKYVNMMF